MSQYFEVHPQNPQARLISQAAKIIALGGVAVVPTDSSYALACRPEDRDAVDRIRRIRAIDERHLLTLLCRDLKELAVYARVDNAVFRVIKNATPGPVTFILEATREVPKKLSHRSRKTIGLRVPDNKVLQALLEEVGEPLVATSMILAGETEPLTDPEAIRENLDRQVDVILSAGACGTVPTTVVDYSGSVPELVREGLADPAVLGL